MQILLVLTSILIQGAVAGLVRLPKIYNALITSDENLSPSQAYPILEPVIRTTALGVAFPPIVVHPPTHDIEPTRRQDGKEPNENKSTNEPVVTKPELKYYGTLYPLAYDSYLPYGYQHNYIYNSNIPYPNLPYYQRPVFVDLGQNENNRKVEEKDVPIVQKAVINFKKNPEIPDVLPPLPIKEERKRKS